MRSSLILAFGAAVVTDGAFVNTKVGGSLRVSNSSSKEKQVSGPHGMASCPCIGIDELDGKTMATIKGGKQVPYPADLGSRCEAWDEKDHPKCPGESWCKSKWCYVDPCKCDKISPYPKPANYLPNAQYQGKPVHFSYTTCDGMDSYSEPSNDDYKKIEETCAVTVDAAKWGQEDCRCVGISGQEGTTKVDIKGKPVKFPADTGAHCNAWEEKNHPECKGADAPKWCTQKWCYVDPCSCKQAISPKTSSYLPDANFQGRPVYYSYSTCGSADSYTGTEYKDACVNQKKSEDCAKLDKCAWTGKNCLGKELVAVCSGPGPLKPSEQLPWHCSASSIEGLSLQIQFTSH